MAKALNTPGPDQGWLKFYYFLRFAVSTAWVVLTFTLGRTAPTLAGIMLIAYPAWDAAANYADAGRSGGLARNKSQMLNFIVSLITAVAVAVALRQSMNAVLAVFGVWAVLSGLFQLVTALRRRKAYGAQWAMILSGAQSGLAGAHMLSKAAGALPPSIADIAPYAAFGAFYFLVSALSLTISDARRNARAQAV